MDRIIVPRFKKELGFSTTEKRSISMGKIRSAHTKPEITLRKALWSLGIRYRANYKKLPGSPDIVLLNKKIAIFVDGEFWHGYNWDIKKTKIKTNRDFWIPKIERNMQRDEENNNLLKGLGYKVIRIWENEIKKDISGCVMKIINQNGK